MYYFIEPEVAGGWGANTIADTSTHPPKVSRLHYQFDGWLGDDLLETFPCFIVSEFLKNDLISSGLSGFVFDDVEISKSESFFASDRCSMLPRFFWLKIIGKDQVSDFGIAPDYRLTISEKALELLQRHTIAHASIEPTWREQMG